MGQYNTIAESNNFIVLDAYTKYNELHEPSVAYQSEASLEREFVQDLVNKAMNIARIYQHLRHCWPMPVCIFKDLTMWSFPIRNGCGS